MSSVLPSIHFRPCMNRGTWIVGDVGGMIRSRKSIGLLAIVLFIASTLWILRQPDRLDLLTPHAPEFTSTLAVSAHIQSHPIYQLIAQAEAEFESVKARQSRTLQDAVVEYRRRYKLPPPPNFDKWYAFAKSKGVELIDEYDTIYHSLLPFWALEPAVIRERTREAIGFDNALISVLIRDGEIVKADGGGDMYAWHREATPVMMKNFLKHLPDMDLAYNIRDEPRIVLQHDDLSRHIQIATEVNAPKAFGNMNLKNKWSPRAADLGDGTRIKEYKTTRFNQFAHQPVWGDSRISCSPESAARSCLNDSCPDNTASYSNLPLGFIRNTTAFSDICNSPSMRHSFGFFDRPNAFSVAHDLFPIFSQSKPSSFQDIVYPSPWYFMGRVEYDKHMDRPWEEKLSRMYWRGSTTGGFSRDGGWRNQHRQRFLSKIQPYGTAKVLKSDEAKEAGAWLETETPMSDLAHLFDVRFTYIGQCDPGDCDEQREYFGTVEPVNMFEAFNSTYLLDIDGNAFSGRYYAWLLSHSLVYKLAIFREWHDERIRPWVHYVPLGLVGDEYVESVRYFDAEDVGRAQARRLAENGRDWAQKALRNQDLEVWYFRLLLEYGRLIDDDRENIGFSV